MKEFDMRERKSAIFLMGILGLLVILYTFLVPEVLIIRVFRKFIPAMWVLIVIFFIVSQILFQRDRMALLQAHPEKKINPNTPITTITGVYRNVLAMINLLSVLSAICVAITIVGYFVQYNNTAVFEYYPIIMTALCTCLEVACVIVFTREGRATKYDKEVINLVKETENWEGALIKADVEEEDTTDGVTESLVLDLDLDLGVISIDE